MPLLETTDYQKICPLCESDKVGMFYSSKQKNLRRNYFQCNICKLIFVPKKFHLSLQLETERYLTHNNNRNNKGYVDFLSRLWIELKPKLNSGSCGLDFGSGPGPVLAEIITEDGFNIETYDPIFQPNKKSLETHYDFITCSETIEHFKEPKKSISLLNELLIPGGWLGIMTGIVPKDSRFSDWYYQKDPTHISFYTNDTISWIGNWMHWEITIPRTNVILFKKPKNQT
tara:strand:+ start:5313 stop:5999 length:687 start_codon:yes stop_codon:yes gene_type:complete